MTHANLTLEGRVARLEKAVFGGRRVRQKNAARSLSEHVLDLRGKGFFKQPRTAPEVHNKLEQTYHCELNRVEVALHKLVRRKQLRKASKTEGNKKRVAYVW